MNIFTERCPCCTRPISPTDVAAIAELGICARCKEELERRLNWHDRVVEYVTDVLDQRDPSDWPGEGRV